MVTIGRRGSDLCKSEPAAADLVSYAKDHARTSGQGEAELRRFALPHWFNMSADAIHATLGIVFTGIWLLVGQILVGDR